MRQRKARIVGAIALAGSLAALSDAQQGGGGSVSPPGGQSDAGQPAGPGQPAGGAGAPNQSGAQPGAGLPAPVGLPPQPGSPSNLQPGTDAEPLPQPASPPASPGGVNAPGPGAPGQPGGAPACPADNPACNPMNPNSPTQQPAGPGGALGAAGSGAQRRRADADGRLTSRVRESLLRGGAVDGAPNLSVTTRGGRVTLRGVVRSEAARQEIGRRAEAAAGAGNVVNELTVAP